MRDRRVRQMNVTLTPEPFVDARRVAELLEIKRRDQCPRDELFRFMKQRLEKVHRKRYATV